MHLKSLTLKGFKSFASATTLKFEPGICAVVGPNGSGKSNVVDALAWVMGEQGAKTLRGGKMEDVIFAGAGGRKPLGRAEVTLTIDNSDGALDIDYTEVSVTRRMFRDGASEYEINGAKARLMDIQELLSDSGIGREMHVIVGQGRLAQILESRPEDRRAFIEEAAGVLKHRRRKEKAQRKLVSMQANVDRLSDLTGELQRQLKPLARQAEAAKRAATVQADLREARLRLAGYQLTQLQQKLESSETRAQLLQRDVAELNAQLETAEQTQNQLEEQLAAATPAADEAQQLWFTLSSLKERMVATSRIAQDRAGSYQVSVYQGADPEELEAKAARADAEYAGLLEQVEIAQERWETIRDEVSEREELALAADKEHLAQVRAIADRRAGEVRLIAQQESLQAQVQAAEAEITRGDEVLTETLHRVRQAAALCADHEDRLAAAQLATEPLQEAHAQAQTEAQAAETRLEQLRDQQRELEREVSRLESRIDTLKATSPQTPTTIHHVLPELKLAPLAKVVTSQAGLEKALAAALGGMVEAVATATLNHEQKQALVQAELPRTTILLGGSETQPWHLDTSLPQGARWLIDELTVSEDYVAVISRLLADVVVVTSLEQAEEVVAADSRLRAVTITGLMVGQAWLSLGAGQHSALEVAADIEDAVSQLTVNQSQLAELQGALEGAKRAAEDARVTAAGATSALKEQEALIAALNRDLQRLRQQHDASRSEHDRTAQRATQAEARLSELKQSLAEITDRLARVKEDDQEPEPSTARRDAAATALEQIKAMEVEARLNVRSATDKAETLRGKGDGLRRQAAHERLAKARHDQANERRRKQAEVAKVVTQAAEDLITRATEATAQATKDRDQKINHRNQLQSQLGVAKDTVSALRVKLERLNDNAHSSEIARSQAQVRMEEAQQSLVEKLGVPVEDIMHDYRPDEDFDHQQETERLQRAEKDLAALGKVNPLALEEYRALEERYEFLSTQLNDVEQAREDLKDVIEEVDRKILQLFSDAWRDVAAEFPEVFATLFPGGEGRLVLTEPDSMLTTGIEVEARPPGKKVKRLSLLSGGEKSLTALAMLVAIFRARPSPFYVMDEVEAALDDVNLRRLIALFEQLRKDSQLIVITHQKPTMDVANVLYGVTMRGDGVTRVLSQRMSSPG
jgi:hypothetical protein